MTRITLTSPVCWKIAKYHLHRKVVCAELLLSLLVSVSFNALFPSANIHDDIKKVKSKWKISRSYLTSSKSWLADHLSLWCFLVSVCGELIWERSSLSHYRVKLCRISRPPVRGQYFSHRPIRGQFWVTWFLSTNQKVVSPKVTGECHHMLCHVTRPIKHRNPRLIFFSSKE